MKGYLKGGGLGGFENKQIYENDVAAKPCHYLLRCNQGNCMQRLAPCLKVYPTKHILLLK